MKDLGPLSYFLGVEVTYSGHNMHLTQSQYALDLLERTKFIDVQPISTPVPTGHKLGQYDGEPYSNPEQYRMVVRALQYLKITRPDLSYSVNQVCQFMHMPQTTHWMAVKRILRYLKTTYDHGNLDTHHSTGGFCIYLGTNLILWSSKKQKTVSRSSTEADDRQLAYTAAELSCLRGDVRPSQSYQKLNSETNSSNDKIARLGTIETDFLMPPVGERWDEVTGGVPVQSQRTRMARLIELVFSNGAFEDGDEKLKELSKRTKRMSIEIGPSSFASRKKKRKKSTT
ncbi:surfeit locus protein 2 [Pyrus ussuriensis x Pyrus communis]|uniref:Surfeit locus protein 2 n=1 Tax=Pyrus ussuriensis x Pyrus communis TaxID=2448454 RepID=A0A5N5FL72_9ROSA|nr:surfeit locus protein 2 [Pyrus ussuriensis x Pyrus communis]